MSDSFFDLGKQLPKMDSESLRIHLEKNDEVFECAFTPTSRLEAPEPGDTIQFKDKVFKRMRFYETHFFRIVFRGCEFNECLFLSAHFDECEFHDCVFIRCNTNKFRLTKTYLDPEAFIKNIFDKRKYANVGVDLFHTLLKNSLAESQPEFRDTAEYHFRLWQRYNRVAYWRSSKGKARWLNRSFYSFWIGSWLYQVLFGYGVKVRNIAIWTPIIIIMTWVYNYTHWSRFGIETANLSTVPIAVKSAYFTIGNLTAFGTADLVPTAEQGLFAVSVQVLVGIGWIALSTAMIVKRFIR